MPTSAEFQAGLEKAVTNMNRLDGFVNDAVPGTVTTDNGTISNLAKFLADVMASVSTSAISGIPGLQSALDSKAAVSHTHLIANVTGLQAALDDKLSGTLLDLRTPVTPERYGAVAIEDGADPTVSQTTAITNALNSGRLVVCNGKTYSLGAPVVPGGNVKGVTHGNFRWTNTTVMAQQQYMLAIIDKDDILVSDNSFDLGTVENCGSNDDSGRGAIRVTSSNEGTTFIKRPRVIRNRVTGNGNGTPIYVRSAINPVVDYNFVHDRIIDGSATNDAQNGIDTSRSSNVQCRGNIVNGLYYRVAGTPLRQFSRGIVAVEVTSGNFSGNMISNVDQGMDFSGGIVTGFPNGNTGLVVSGNVVSDVRTWGIKFANSIRDSVCIGNVVRNFGWGGIVVSGQSAAWTAGQSAKATSHLLITGNYIFDPSDYYSRTDCIGIWVIFRAEYPGYPTNIRIVNNTIRNSTGNGRLLHGISQDDGDGGHNVVAGAPYNEVSGNTIIGQTGAPTLGCVPHAICALTGGSSQAIPNATWTAATWDVETIDGQGMHANGSNPESIFPNGAGWYDVSFSVVFGENATGVRQARILRSGGSLPGGQYAAVALSGADTTVSGRCLVYLSASQNVRVEVYQNSGGAINVLRPNSQLFARRIEQM